MLVFLGFFELEESSTIVVKIVTFYNTKKMIQTKYEYTQLQITDATRIYQFYITQIQVNPRTRLPGYRK